MFMTVLMAYFILKNYKRKNRKKNKNMVRHIYIKDGTGTLIKILEDNVKF